MNGHFHIAALAAALFGGVALLAGGCVSPDVFAHGPVFEAAVPPPAPKPDSALARQHAQEGWLAISRYRRDPAANRGELVRAQEAFNRCWAADPGDYNAFWGWGVIRTEQAAAVPPTRSERLLKDSARYLSRAGALRSLPPGELVNLLCDVAGAYNGLGALYRERGDDAAAEESFGWAERILKRALGLPGRPSADSGRLCMLLSYTAYYRRDFAAADRYYRAARDKGAALPPDYRKDLDRALEAAAVGD